MAEELTAYQALNERRRIFVDEYCTGSRLGKTYNATSAAKAAGFSSPEMYGLQLRQNEKVKLAIEERLRELTMSKDELIKRFQDIADSDVGDILEIDEYGRPRINHEALMKKRKFLKSFSYDSNGNPKYEFHDAHSALRDLAKAFGISGNEGMSGPVNVTVNINFVAPGQDPGNVNSALPPTVPSGEGIAEGEWEELAEADEGA